MYSVDRLTKYEAYCSIHDQKNRFHTYTRDV